MERKTIQIQSNKNISRIDPATGFSINGANNNRTPVNSTDEYQKHITRMRLKIEEIRPGRMGTGETSGI